jgi:predicted RNase H-like HicB family nuclease
MSRYKFSVVIEKDIDGYFAFCPELQGCYTQGDSYEKVLENIKDAIKLHIEVDFPRNSGHTERLGYNTTLKP